MKKWVFIFMKRKQVIYFCLNIKAAKY